LAHKSTLDDVRDEKLRSKTAALLLVGINLKDLGIDFDGLVRCCELLKLSKGVFVIVHLRKMLPGLTKEFVGKLQQLAAAHKAIVDALTKLLPSSSSADEILPTLIYLKRWIKTKLLTILIPSGGHVTSV
jgi:hypothetical protein